MSDAKIKKSIPKPVKAVIALLILSIAGGAICSFLIRTPPAPPNLIKLSGRIEGDDTTVATKISGRVREIQVREGDTVQGGQVIALMDGEQVRARRGAAPAGRNQGGPTPRPTPHKPKQTPASPVTTNSATRPLQKTATFRS